MIMGMRYHYQAIVFNIIIISTIWAVAAVELNQSTDLASLNNMLQQSSIKIQEFIDGSKNVDRLIKDSTGEMAVADCLELMDLSITRIMDSAGITRNWTAQAHDRFSDVQTWLSGVLTNHVTCLDGLNGLALSVMESQVKALISEADAALGLVLAVAGPFKGEILSSLNGKLPEWVGTEEESLLEARPPAANVVVAQDGSGNCKTIGEAVVLAPVNSTSRYVIYIKKGIYHENVVIDKHKKNLMLVGDGMDLTIISASLSVGLITTFQTATLGVAGDGFMARDIGIQNTAGPEKRQAVALKIQADRAVVYRCRIDGYQDSLYVHSYRQFYRNCTVTGTVDFIFGRAAAVFQYCTIAARKPMNSQSNTITAQGRLSLNQNSAISIQNCWVIPSSDLQPVEGSVKTYLGRPWKEYSTTVFMASYIGDHVDPAGWLEWNGEFALKTLYYGEYKNEGPGSDTRNRVKWPGYHVITDPAEAGKFTVAGLLIPDIKDDWLSSTGVPYKKWL